MTILSKPAILLISLSLLCLSFCPQTIVQGINLKTSGKSKSVKDDDDDFNVDPNMALGENQYMFGAVVSNAENNQADKEDSGEQREEEKKVNLSEEQKKQQQQEKQQSQGGDELDTSGFDDSNQVKLKNINLKQDLTINKKEVKKEASKPAPPTPEQIEAQKEELKQKELNLVSQHMDDGITLKNINNQQYVGTVAIGSPPQPLTVMFDTGSSIMYALSTRCKKGCPKRLEKFDPELSSSFQDFSDKRQEQNYGKGFVQGSMAQDQVCFSQEQDKCMGINFLAVDGGNELQKDQFSGIIGLAPASTEEKSIVPSFIGQNNKVFSFYFSKGSGSTGNLKFGGYSIDKFAKSGSTEQDIIWNNLVEESEGWTIPLQGLRFHNGSKVEIKSEQITLDTGLSYCLVPPRDIDDIRKSIQAQTNITCKQEGFDELDMFSCDCDQKQYNMIKPLQMNINGRFFTLPVDAWMSFDPSKDSKQCKILMHPYDISMTATLKWVLGLQFLQNFYTIFDMEHKRIGIIEAKE